MDDRKKIVKEITDLMAQLSTDDLAFLKEQASVLEYNRKVRQENENRKKEGEKGLKKAGDKKTAKSGAKKKAPDDGVRIEQTDRPRFFNICIGNSRLFADIHEIKALYKIASAAGSPAEAGPRLFRWIQKERSDFLSEVYIPDGKSPVLQKLYRALMDTFTSDS